MLAEISGRSVALRVIEQLECHRQEIVGDETRVRALVEQALGPVRAEYRETELPPEYLAALENELRDLVPGRWRAVAAEFTALERRHFDLWRGGDPLSRVSYVALALALGGLMVWAPFIPIWEKWFPFALSLLAFFLPDIQTAWYKRRYEHALGRIALAMDQVQPRLDAHLTAELAADLLLAGAGHPGGGAAAPAGDDRPDAPPDPAPRKGTP